ncbi:MAG: radical SAM family heme chaperone HemW [Bacteroidia bacterium]|nr:radical SAM family heme chaperone HemW [Bacteroidia bacterium]
MAGIYLHIPFCRQACHYCDFHFSVSHKGREEVLAAMRQELNLRAAELQGQTVRTLYFGGGTPSLLTRDELMQFFDVLYAEYAILPEAEITLEANPDDITDAYFRELRNTPVNRLSIGIQSFRAEDLLEMNRAHTPAQALSCAPRAADAGFGNISIDLIFGWPRMEQEDWQQNVATAFSLPITHLSCYGLTIEPRTALSWQIVKGLRHPPDEEKAAMQYEYLLGEAERLGFPWYEISNFSKPGFQSKHNTAYWQGVDYLGIGPSAHSFNGNQRSWNVRSNAAYLSGMQRGQREFESEVLSSAEKFHELMLTSLRVREGLWLGKLRQEYGEAITGQVLEAAQPFISKGWMLRENERLSLSPAGLLLADKITSELFII